MCFNRHHPCASEAQYAPFHPTEPFSQPEFDCRSELQCNLHALQQLPALVDKLFVVNQKRVCVLLCVAQ